MPSIPPKFHKVVASLYAQKGASEKEYYVLDSMLIVAIGTHVAKLHSYVRDCNVVGKRGSFEGHWLSFGAIRPGDPLMRNNR